MTANVAIRKTVPVSGFTDHAAYDAELGPS